MIESSASTVMIGAGVSSFATYVLGPAVGEYAVILGMAFIGTLVSLTDEDFHAPEGLPMPLLVSTWEAVKFIFRGVALSFAFAGILAYIVAGLLPKSYGLTPYAILSTVAFTIGWTSNKWAPLKERIISWLGGSKN